MTAEWLRDNRHLFSPAGSDPSGTVALIGGWPFYASIAVFRQWGVPTVALDCGGVPYEDMKGPARMVQERFAPSVANTFPKREWSPRSAILYRVARACPMLAPK